MDRYFRLELFYTGIVNLDWITHEKLATSTSIIEFKKIHKHRLMDRYFRLESLIQTG